MFDMVVLADGVGGRRMSKVVSVSSLDCAAGLYKSIQSKSSPTTRLEGQPRSGESTGETCLESTSSERWSSATLNLNG
jgi:hypothetical protein